MLHPQHIHADLESQSKTPKCPIGDKTPEQYSFTADVECKYSCNGDKAPRAKTISKYFNPGDEGMIPGDGYDEKSSPMFASFTSLFMNWSTNVCMQAGVAACGSLEKVDSADFSSISSGTWKLSEKPTCEQNKKILYSPYDSQFKLNREGKKESLSATNNPVVIPLGVYIPFDQPNEKSTCKNPIKGKVCFGDCILYDEKHPKVVTPFTLMTKESPVFNQDESVCADSLFAAYSKLHLSKSVAEAICQNFFITTLSQPRTSGSSCAAFRGTADCSAFVASFH